MEKEGENRTQGERMVGGQDKKVLKIDEEEEEAENILDDRKNEEKRR